MLSGDDLGIIPTKAMLAQGHSAGEFTPTVFQEKKMSTERRKIEQDKKRVGNVGKPEEDNIFDIRRARHDVIKFGMSGFEEVEKQKATVAMAIKLGAKPPKREYKNYKEVQKERKLAKDAQAQQESFQTLGKKSTGEALFSHKKFTKNRRKRKDAAEVLKDYGKVSSSSTAASDSGGAMTLATKRRRR